MKKLKTNLKKVVFVAVAAVAIIIPSVPVYSAEGAYSEDSSIVKTSNLSDVPNSTESPEAALPAIAAVAGAIAIGVVAVVGFVDGWNSHHKEQVADLAFVEINPNDFSKFDN